MGWFSGKSTEQHLQDDVDALRDRATGSDRKAKTLDKVGAKDAAKNARYEAKLDRRLADQQEKGLRSGAYKAGRRQHPSVEEQLRHEAPNTKKWGR